MTTACSTISSIPKIAQLCQAYTGDNYEERDNVVAFIQSQFHERVFRSVTVDPSEFPLHHPFLTRLPVSKDAFTIVLSYLPISEMIAISDISNDPAVWFSRAITLQTAGNFSLPILTQIYAQVPRNSWAALPRLQAAGLSARSIDVALDIGALVTQTDAIAGARLRRYGLMLFVDIPTKVRQVKIEAFDSLLRVPQRIIADLPCLICAGTVVCVNPNYQNPFDRRRQAGDYHSASVLITRAQNQLEPLLKALPPPPPVTNPAIEKAHPHPTVGGAHAATMAPAHTVNASANDNTNSHPAAGVSPLVALQISLERRGLALY